MNNKINWNGLIFLKFLSVLIMIFAHTFFFLIGDYGVISNTESTLFQISQKLQFIGLFIFLLPILAGIIFKLNLSEQKFKTIGITSLILVIISITMNTITWGFWYAKSWNILQLVALTYILLYMLKKINFKHIIEMGFLISLILSPILNYFLSKYNVNYFIGILIGNNSELIFWPIFPWISIILFGYLIGKYYILNTKKFIRYSIIIGLVGIIISNIFNSLTININPDYIWGENMFRANLGFILSLISFSLLTIGISTKIFENKKFSKFSMVNSFSKGILLIYIWQMFAAFHIAKWMKTNINLGYYLENIYTIESLFIFLFLPILMILTSWGIGALLIKINEKKINIKIKKIV